MNSNFSKFWTRIPFEIFDVHNNASQHHGKNGVKWDINNNYFEKITTITITTITIAAETILREDVIGKI
jgi:hypothetical protein